MSQSSSFSCKPIPWSFLPIFASIVPLIGFCLTYLVAKLNCHTEKWYLPYVSYTGTRFPELMYFGLILNLEGFLGLTVVFLAWRYYRHLQENNLLNLFSLIVGSFCCCGVILVGNFPVTKCKILHYLGASMAFLLGTLYTILTALLSCRAHKTNMTSQDVMSQFKYNSGRVRVYRTLLAVLMTLSLFSLIGYTIYKKVFQEKDKEEEILSKRIDLVTPLKNGSCLDYPNTSKSIDLFGAIVEWLLTVGILVCIFLYSYEFQSFNRVKIVLKQQNGILLRKCNCDKVTYLQDNDVTIHKDDANVYEAAIDDDDVTIGRTVDDVMSDYVTMGSDILQMRGNNET